MAKLKKEMAELCTPGHPLLLSRSFVGVYLSSNRLAQLLMFFMGLFMVLSVIMLPVGLILMGVAWIWGLITAGGANNKPQIIVVERKD